MKINRKQFIAFLGLISLKGIDDEVKIRKLVNDAIIHFKDDSMVCYGVDDTENIMFNHIYEIEYTEENDDPDRIIINDINKWIDYLKSFKDDTISLSSADASITIAAGSSLYNIPLSVPESIRSYQRSDGIPLVPYTKDKEWYKISGEVDGNEIPSLKKDWSEFQFKSSIFLESIGSGKNIDNMNLTLYISKLKVGVEVGDINDLATPSYSNQNLDGIHNVSWKFKTREKLDWKCTIGLHSILFSIDQLDQSSKDIRPSIFYKGPDSNLIIRSNKGSLKGSPIISTWVIGSPPADDFDYDDNEDDFDEDED